MTNYLLFVDVETSGLPVNWHLPYSAEGNWPSAVQVSWLVYTPDGQEVKRETHYILNTDFFITPRAMEIHGINPGILAVKGKLRNQVMEMLADDLNKYQPLVVGHFVQLDYHVLGADFYRAGIDNPLPQLPLFCTMLATTQFIWNPMPQSLLLGDLYAYLFYKPMQNQHNALNDAEATAQCFFELMHRGEMNEKLISLQQDQAGIKNLKAKSGKLLQVFIPLVILILIILLAHHL
ncbi:3'-5' exonuclease [Mucilaginibacter sp. PAMB04168]|uniref:3'-5' exonuclease n=1 Tax=Mucilaginibacter sp. PAMB04168 TaxID=3138567 RepID=UPI0031F65E38